MYQFIIKEIRKEKNITIEELSKRTGIKVSYLKDIENNKIENPKFETICKICLVLNEKIDDIFFNDEDIESVDNILNKYVEKYGLTDKRTMEISSIMDQLSIKEMTRRKNKKKFKYKKSRK